jgi:hypothetical protein
VIVLVGVALALCLLMAPVGSAEPAASRVIDRTFACETGFLGGIYQARVESHWFVPEGSRRRAAFASVTTNLKDGFVGGISAQSIYANRLYCKAATAKLPLTTKGLRGGAFDPLGAEHWCDTPRRVLFRIRGEFLKPTTLRTASPFGYPQLQARGNTKQTQLAIGTQNGKPIAYMSIAGSKAQLYTSTLCRED